MRLPQRTTEDPGGLNANNFRPLLGFASLPLATHNLYANYNSMQVKYMRTRGRAVINVNYTFGKALGIVSSTLDSFNLNNDYGVQATNRTHIFNAAYSYDLGRLVRNRVAGGLVNGWQIPASRRSRAAPTLRDSAGRFFGMALNSAKIRAPRTTSVRLAIGYAHYHAQSDCDLRSGSRTWDRISSSIRAVSPSRIR
jgi:hypothetical protein